MQSSLPPQNLESAPAPAEPFNIPSTTLTASSDGNSYTAIYSETPNNGTTMFDGQEANSSTISLAITENGTPIVTESDTAYYLENPYQPLGLTLSSNGGQFDFIYNSTDPPCGSDPWPLPSRRCCSFSLSRDCTLRCPIWSQFDG